MSSSIPRRENTLVRISARGSNATMDEVAALSFIQHLDMPTLRSLLDDEVALLSRINETEQVRALKSDKETLLASNKSLAEFNLTKRMPLAQGTESLNTLYSTLKGLKQEVDVLSSQYDSKSNVQCLDATHAVLQAKAAQTEEEAEAISGSFLSGGCEVDTFMEQYLAKKSKAHLQRIKSEKLGEMIHRQQTGAAQSQASHHSYMPTPGAIGGPSPQAPYSYLPSVST